MSELLVDYITSLDGYGTAEGWPGWWGLEGPEYLGWLTDQPEDAYTVLMGATTYRLMSAMATGPQEDYSDTESDSLAGLGAFPTVVFSSTLEEPLAWPKARLARGDAVATVAAMKSAGESMRTIGSISLCRSLLTAGLVDRFRVVVFPVITGRTGTGRINDDYPDVALDLLQSRTFDGRTQLLEYAPTVLTEPLRRPGG